MPQVLNGPREIARIVEKEPEPFVAVSAQEAADLSRGVIVIDVEDPLASSATTAAYVCSLANRATTSLRRQHHVELSERDSVITHQIVRPFLGCADGATITARRSGSAYPAFTLSRQPYLPLFTTLS